MTNCLWEKIMSYLRTVVDVLRPGNPEFKAHLSMITQEQARLVRALQVIDSAANRDLKAATDSAAEF